MRALKRLGLVFQLGLLPFATGSLHAEPLRFVTINVWSGLNYRGAFKMGEYENTGMRAARARLLEEQLEKLDADVVGCNEANPLPAYARSLAGGLHADCIYHVGVGGLRIGPVGLPVNLREGDVIMAKKEWQLKSLGRCRLSGGPVGNFFSFHFADATQIIVGRMTVAKHPLYVFNTHWQSEPKDPAVSLTEARKTIAFIAKVAGDHPVVLMGDLNATPDAPAVRLLNEAGFIDAYAAANPTPAATWDEVLNTNIAKEFTADHVAPDTTRARKRIDFIFVRGAELKVIRASLVLDKLVAGQHVSDHFGVMAEIAFSPVETPGRPKVD